MSCFDDILAILNVRSNLEVFRLTACFLIPAQVTHHISFLNPFAIVMDE